MVFEFANHLNDQQQQHFLPFSSSGFYWPVEQQQQNQPISNEHQRQMSLPVYGSGSASTSSSVPSIAREYAHVNEAMPRDYWDYDNAAFQWG